MMKNGKSAIKESVAQDMVNKNEKIDSNVVKCKELKTCGKDFVSNICCLLFFNLRYRNNVELKGFGFNAQTY